MKGINMEMGTPNVSGNALRRWIRVLRPLVWWALLVLALFCYRTHQELIARTRLTFTVALEGRPADYESRASLDGVSFSSGDRVALGKHIFAVSHPKGEPFETNMFIWYGGQELGRIDLKRSKGTLAIQASPPALRLSIRGSEFNVTLTNSSGMTAAVPTDRYQVEAKYLRWQDAREVSVAAGSTARWSIAPPLGAVQIACNREGASYQLFAASGELLAHGADLPKLISELPQGNYRLVAEHGGNRLERLVTIKTGITNDVRIEFLYGGAILESEPPGARVLSADGRDWGTTPANLSELLPGRWEFRLGRQGYEPVVVALQVTANQTNTFRTNLVSTAYVEAISAARRLVAEGDYDRAVEAAGEAVRIQPDDPIAHGLRREAGGRAHLGRAKAFGARGDYVAAVEELETATTFLPENVEVRELGLEYAKQQQRLAEEQVRKREQALAEKERQERLGRPMAYFEQWMKTAPNSELFDQFALTVRGKVDEVEAKLVQALTNGKPAFKLVTLQHPKAEVFCVRAMLDLGTGGWRRCDLVGGQSSDGEVTLVFKVFEYAYVEAFSIRAWIKDNDEKNMVPIHASRIDPTKPYLLPRRAEGVRMVKERIEEVARATR